MKIRNSENNQISRSIYPRLYQSQHSVRKWKKQKTFLSIIHVKFNIQINETIKYFKTCIHELLLNMLEILWKKVGVMGVGYGDKGKI